MEDEKLVKKAQQEAKTMQKELTETRRQLREATEMQETQAALKTFTHEMLGAGKERAGGADIKNGERRCSNAWPRKVRNSRREDGMIGFGSSMLGTTG